jgi:FkbM family methyltransferase
MFEPYIAENRVFNDMNFDFYIANETGKLWYDSDQNQFMPERQWCVERLKPGMTVVDCGAHHGMMSVIFAKAVGPKGKVFAYEALPSNADVISRNAELNGLRNVVVRPMGVGASSGAVPFDLNLSNAVVSRHAPPKEEKKGLFAMLSSLVIEQKRGRKPTENEIQIVVLDADLPRGTKVDFLKIDVEGFEAEAISGMRRVLAQKPIIDLEIHNFLSQDPATDMSKLAIALDGYRFTALGEIFGQQRDMGTLFDLDYLMQFDNPHVFCEPA